MRFINTDFDGLFVVELQKFTDERGYFMEKYNRSAFEQAGLKYDFVQDNCSRSCYGTVRGLHFQKGQYAQAKLVQVLEGQIRDVVVDLRPDSRSFGKYYAVELSAENSRSLLVPRGFAHGFSVLSESVLLTYKCDNFYCPASEEIGRAHV